MIQANDLRIGNLIFVGQGETVPIRQIKNRGVVVSRGKHPKYFRFEDIEHVPIMAEVLEKLGFLKEEMADGFSDYSLNGVRISLPYFEFSYDAGDCSIEVKSLHQLQNLYFALTGQELIIDP